MTSSSTTRSISILALLLLAMPAVAVAQGAQSDLTPAMRWQQWITRQKRLPVGAGAYNDALDDKVLLVRYMSAGFNVLPKAHWSKGSVLAAGSSAALDLGMSSGRSVGELKGLIKSGPTPALVLLGQELVPDQFKVTAEQAEAINIATDGGALPLTSLLPNWYVYFDRLDITYEQYVEQFIAQSKAEALMAVELPLMGDGTDREFYYDELDVLRRESLEHNIGLFGMVQAIGHGPRFREPSASDLRWQVYSYLAYGAKGLWYYFFAGNGTDDGLTTGLSWYPKQLGPAKAPRGFGLEQTPAAKQSLDTLRQINDEVSKLGPTLLKLHSTGVFYNGTELPPGIDSRRDEATSPFTEFTGDDVLVGVFRRTDNPGEDLYALIVNTRHGPDAQAASFETAVSFTVAPSFSTVEVIDAATGRPRRLLAAGHTRYTVGLAGGRGMLVHCR